MAKASSEVAAALLLAFLFVLPSAFAFYLPGVAPRDFQSPSHQGFHCPGRRSYCNRNRLSLQVKVNKLSSTKTQLPYDYYFLDYCKPSTIINSAEILGEVLRGDPIENSVYTFKMRKDEACKIVCRSKLSSEAAKDFKEKIEDEYRVNMILDNLSVALPLQRRDGSKPPSYEHGFRVGYKSKDNKYYINNHLNFKVMYHKDEESESACIVGFEVVPSSIMILVEIITRMCFGFLLWFNQLVSLNVVNSNFSASWWIPAHYAPRKYCMHIMLMSCLTASYLLRHKLQAFRGQYFPLNN